MAEIKQNEWDSTVLRPWGMEINKFCMLMHFSQLAGYVVPMAGLILPIVMWATNKDQSELVDRHGRNIFNWMLSSFIYMVIGMMLIIILIGIPMLIGVVILSLIFIIIGAIKANEGVVFKYPLAIPFF
ncbi:MAG: DUF4870 domain-containing protein [Bacteroidetes bacterium]|nr:DUF4870 domain-containing protein [Bacteroidota bacterium]